MANSKEYIDRAITTLSPNYYGELVTKETLQQALIDFIEASERLDEIKKQLFYGRGYIETSPHHYGYSCKPLGHTQQERDAMHALIGIATESGELAECLLEKVKNDTSYDIANLSEEQGDMFWYMAIMANTFGFTFEQSQETNIEKLKARFPDKFTNADANNRDLTAERKILEKGVDKNN